MNKYESYTETQALTDDTSLDSIMKWTKEYFEANYSKIIPNSKQIKILDIACGYGRYIKVLQERGYTDCYGIDISEQQINYAQKTLEISDVERADALSYLGDKACSYDCVIAIDILEHLNYEELIELGNKVHASLKHNGLFIIQVPNGSTLINPIVYGDLTHQRAFTTESMKQFLLRSGFRNTFEFYESCQPCLRPAHHLKKLLWKGIIRPLISLVATVSYKKMTPGIFTSNFIAVARKD